MPSLLAGRSRLCSRSPGLQTHAADRSTINLSKDEVYGDKVTFVTMAKLDGGLQTQLKVSLPLLANADAIGGSQIPYGPLFIEAQFGMPA